MTESDEQLKSLSPSLSETTDEEKPDHRRHITRRWRDRVFIRALIGGLAFLFIVNVIIGTYQFTTVDRVDHIAAGLKTTFCLTTSAYRSALAREKILVHRATDPKERVAHRQSVHDLRKFLAQLDMVGINCRGEPTIKL